MALSKRLSAIVEVVDSSYDEIWDCCCDHGLLGIELLRLNKAEKIHFVDIVPELMQTLNNKLERFATGAQRGRWQVHCQDVAMITPDPKKRHLVIIAGVGGELLVQFLAKIISHHPDSHIDFIVCPVHHSYQLRSYLQTLKLGLVSEQLVCENKRFYEVIVMSLSSSKQISRVGREMWQRAGKEHQTYLKQLCAHYQRMLNHDAASYQPVFDEYTALII